MATPRYQIEPADLTASAHAVQTLWRANLVGHDAASAAAKWQLGYTHNAAGTGCILLLRGDGAAAPLGVQGLHPRSFVFGAAQVRAAAFADFAVDAAHRSVGPALMLMKRGAQEARERYELTYGLPNRRAAAVLARAGLRRIGTVRRHAKVLASRAALAGRMPAFLAALAAPLVDVCLHARDIALRWSAGERLYCRDVAWDDPALDALWARRPAGLLLGERSAAMLRWRYAAAGRDNWTLTLVCARDGSPRGCLVWRRADAAVRLSDFLAAQPASHTAAMLLAFASHVRRRGAASITLMFFGPEAVVAQVRAAGFLDRPEQTPLFKAVGGDPAFDTPELWYITEFDNDGD